ncbi:MAG TPA: hypothetical protein VMB73_25930 [Acetobacteraceae bacterium]|nr:hypothetical protein [Acetobacteraceae bacterium]
MSSDLTYGIALQSAVSLSDPVPLKWVHTSLNGGSGWSSGSSPTQKITAAVQQACGGWQSETTEFPLAGTGGNVTYEIQDTCITWVWSSGTTLTSLPGKGNQFTISWGNPTVGEPGKPTWSWQQSGDIYDIQILSCGEGIEGNTAGDIIAQLAAGLVVGPLTWFVAANPHPWVYLQLTFAAGRAPSYPVVSMRKKLQNLNLSAGLRAQLSAIPGLATPGGSISFRSVAFNYVV